MRVIPIAGLIGVNIHWAGVRLIQRACKVAYAIRPRVGDEKAPSE